MRLFHLLLVIVPLAVPFAIGGELNTNQEQSPFPKFAAVTLNPEAGKVVYAVTVADVDGDQKSDIVAVTENRVLCYMNPDWNEVVILEGKTELDNVCIAPHDIDGDGRIDFALGAGWTKIGTLQWLGRDPDGEWKLHSLGKETWLHRVRFGDFLGTGVPQLVISPLNRTQGEGVRLMAFEIPKQPAREPWKSTILDDRLNAMHNHEMVDYDGDGQTDILTASMEGVFLFQYDRENKKIVRKQLGKGMPGELKPQVTGAGEIRMGRLDEKGERKFICTIEPMHGTSVVVYGEPVTPDGMLTRYIVDETLRRGHAIGIGDINLDGRDDLVIGHSDPGASTPGISVFTANGDSLAKWSRHVIDEGGITTEDLAVADFDGDGDLDIVGGGRATHNIKIYWNRSRERVGN